MSRSIGIVTFHRADNFGAVLQCMALARCLREIHPMADVQILDYRCQVLEEPYYRPIYRCKTRHPLRYVRRFVDNVRYYSDTCGRRAAFDVFRREYLRMTKSYSLQELIQNPPKFDLLITGSDQVWNSKIVGETDDPIYSLDFASGGRRVSYAASAGSSAAVGKGTLKRLAKLDEISVREEDLASFLDQQLDRKVRVNVDPVFLLTPEQWEELLPKERIVEEPFVFAYCVSDDKMADISRISQKLAEGKNCRIVYVDYRERYGKRGQCYYATGPLDFLRFIRDAEIVVASSFHAAAFSAIFSKPLVAVPSGSTGVRVMELLKDLGLAKQSVSNAAEFDSRYEEFSTGSQPQSSYTLDRYRGPSMAYLRELLNSVEG